jgi:hypothetical protein
VTDAVSDQVTRERLNNLVFTAVGVVEWLFGLRKRVGAMLSGKEPTQKVPVAADAIQVAEGRSDGM